MDERSPLPPAPVGYAETLSDEWKDDADSHWFFYGRAEEMRKQADLVLTPFLRQIMPAVVAREDIDAIDRRQMVALATFLEDGSVRAALSSHLNELMTLLRYASDHYDADASEASRLMADLTKSVDFEVRRRADRIQRDRPAQRPN